MNNLLSHKRKDPRIVILSEINKMAEYIQYEDISENSKTQKTFIDKIGSIIVEEYSRGES